MEEFHRAVVKPLDPKMTTRRVADEFFKPYTKDKGDGGLETEDDLYVISQNDDNEFGILVRALTDHFCDTYCATRVRILIDLFAIDDIHTKAELQEELRHAGASVLAVDKGKAVCPSREMALLDKVIYCIKDMYCDHI
jgi:hypothetical protein